MNRLWTALLAISILTGCSVNNEISRRAIAGKYILNRSNYGEFIKVLDNGKYEHVYQLLDGRIVSEGGDWNFGIRSGNCSGVQFGNFHFVYRAIGSRLDRSRGDWWVCPEIYPDGVIVLPYNQDQDLFFRKQQ